MLQSPNLQKTFIIAENMDQNTTSRDFKYTMCYIKTLDRQSICHTCKSVDWGKTRATIVASAGFILTIFAKSVFHHRCINLVMANLHANSTKSPYLSCYPLRAFLSIMTPKI